MCMRWARRYAAKENQSSLRGWFIFDSEEFTNKTGIIVTDDMIEETARVVAKEQPQKKAELATAAPSEPKQAVWIAALPQRNKSGRTTAGKRKSSAFDDFQVGESLKVPKKPRLASTANGRDRKDDADICQICKNGGELLVCDGCTRCFHLECVGLANIPPDDKWFCDACSRSKAKPKKTPPQCYCRRYFSSLEALAEHNVKCAAVQEQVKGGSAPFRCSRDGDIPLSFATQPILIQTYNSTASRGRPLVQPMISPEIPPEHPDDIEELECYPVLRSGAKFDLVFDSVFPIGELNDQWELIHGEENAAFGVSNGLAQYQFEIYLYSPGRGLESSPCEDPGGLLAPGYPDDVIIRHVTGRHQSGGAHQAEVSCIIPSEFSNSQQNSWDANYTAPSQMTLACLRVIESSVHDEPLVRAVSQGYCRVQKAETDHDITHSRAENSCSPWSPVSK